MLDGTAHKPFVYRRLVPMTINFVNWITPSIVEQETVYIVSNSSLAMKMFSYFDWEPENAYSYLIFCAIAYISFLLFSLFCAKLALTTTAKDEKPDVLLLLSSLALIGLPPLFCYSSLLYDPAQLFLFTASLYFLHESRWKAYFLFFTAVCLNKETAVLLIPVSIIFSLKNNKPKTAIVNGIIQLTIFIVIKLILTLCFYDNPGKFMEFHFKDHNLALFITSYDLKGLLLFISFVWVCFSCWSHLPLFLKVSFLSILPPLLFLTLFLGFLDEWRDYYEAYPVIFSMAYFTYKNQIKNIHLTSSSN
jgi:hypothetical protein